MGILQRLAAYIDPTSAVPALARASLYPIPSGSPIVSIPVSVLEGFGVSSDSETVTRAAAIRVPTIKRGRAIICGTLGALPLRAGVIDHESEDITPHDADHSSSRLVSTLDPRRASSNTLTWTFDDLVFHGVAWWRVLSRDASTNYPIAIERIHTQRVMVDTTAGKVRIDGQEVDDSDIIRIDGPDEGILQTGGTTIQTAILLEKAVRRNAQGMPPQDYLRPVEGAEDLDDDERDTLLGAWRSARDEHATGYLNRSIEYHAVGFDPRAGQLAEARQHQAAELARLLNLPADTVDAPSGGSMNYTNTESKRLDLVTSLAPYITAIQDRLTMGDVTPRGTVIRLDVTGFLRGTMRERIANAKDAVAAGLMSAEEARVKYLSLPAAPSLGALPAPQERPAE